MSYSYLDALDRMRKPSGAKVAGFINKAPSRASALTPKPRAKTTGGGAISRSAPARQSYRPVGNKATTTQPLNRRPPARTRAPEVSSTPPVRARPPARNTVPARNAGGGGGGGGGGTWNYGSVSASPTGQYGGAPLGGGGGGGFAGALGAPAPPPMSDEEYLPTDSIYVSEAAGINSDVQALLDSLKRDRASYDVDFGAALRNLGWDLGEKGLAEPGQGQWRQQDMTGAYGSAYNNQQNDYAGRGMLTSSFYGKALEDLLSSFDRQRGDMTGARQRQFDDFTAQEGEANTQRRQGLDRARASALARRAAGLSLGGF